MLVEQDCHNAWICAADAVKREYAALPAVYLDRIAKLVSKMKSLKSLLFELTGSIGGEAVCETCNGGCCDSGMYHFTVTDLLAFLSDGKKLFIPNFGNSRCPYLGPDGCLMEPKYRPFNCITFNCERLEDLLAEKAVRKFYEAEKELRACYVSMERLFDNTFAYGLASNYERCRAGAGGILFRMKQNQEF